MGEVWCWDGLSSFCGLVAAVGCRQVRRTAYMHASRASKTCCCAPCTLGAAAEIAQRSCLPPQPCPQPFRQPRWPHRPSPPLPHLRALHRHLLAVHAQEHHDGGALNLSAKVLRLADLVAAEADVGAHGDGAAAARRGPPPHAAAAAEGGLPRCQGLHGCCRCSLLPGGCWN